MPPIVAVVFALMFAAIIAWLVSVHLVLRRVQRAHPELYEDMGRPHVILNNTPQNNGPVLSLILGRGYRGLQDPVLERLGDRARIVFFAACVLIVAFPVAAVTLK